MGLGTYCHQTSYLHQGDGDLYFRKHFPAAMTTEIALAVTTMPMARRITFTRSPHANFIFPQLLIPIAHPDQTTRRIKIFRCYGNRRVLP